MMPIKGLDPKEVVLPKKVLPAKSIYFSSIALSMWDNIHGPKILQVWQTPAPVRSEGGQRSRMEATPSPATENTESSETLEDTLRSTFELSDSTILSVANYTLNDEAGRTDEIIGIESKFYSLSKYNLIAYASIFTIELVKGRTEVFSLLLLLPISETSEFLARFMLCEVCVQKLLQEFFLGPLKEGQKDRSVCPRGSVKNKIDEVLKDFDKPLLKFTQTMVNLKQNPLPNDIKLIDTLFGADSSRPDVRAFLPQVINSHLQTSGYTIVLGSDRAAINKMILTLGLFLSPKERKMSRLVGEGEREDLPTYEPHLFLQGLVWAFKRRDSLGLPFSKADLYLNKLPHTIVLLDEKQVLQVETKVNCFIGRKDFDGAEHPEAKVPAKSMDAPCHLRDFHEVDKDMMSQTVKEFLLNLFSLNAVNGLRETFIAQFLRLMKLKALALAKYLDSEIKPGTSSLEVAAEVLALKPASTAALEKRRISLVTLQNDLAIDGIGDLYAILASTEKIRPRTYIDVLGDPQLDNIDVIKEFASL